MSTNITLQDSRTDGITAATALMQEGFLRPEHITATVADPPWDGYTLGDAAWQFFSEYSRHWQATAGQNYFEKQGARFARVGEDWEDEHWDAFVAGFTDEARRLAQQRGWNTEVQANG